MSETLAVATTVAVNTLTFSAPILLGALGGLASERSGVINIGLEGKMLAAACATGLVSTATGSAPLGLLAGVLTAVLLAWLHAVLTQTYRIDHVVSGMGINALSIGGTNLVAKVFSGVAAEKMPGFPVAVYWIAAYTLAVAVWWYIRSTKGGIRLLAVGNDPDKSRQMGINPVKVRFLSLTWTGVFTGLAGALIVTNAGSFSDGMTSGRGYIALAALILGGWRPVQALAACVLFGSIFAVQLQFQGLPIGGLKLPNELWQSLPYLVTLLAVAGMIGKGKAPAGLGRS